MKRKIGLFLLAIIFFSCGKNSMNDQIMNYINKNYKDKGYATFYYLDDISDFYQEYYTYIHVFSELCSDIFSGGNNISGLENQLRASKAEVTKSYAGQGNIEYELDLGKVKQSEVYVILEQFFQQYENKLDIKGLKYYKKQIDQILEYLNKHEF